MDSHGITMKGDFETNNIKSQDGVSAITIDDTTGKTTLKNEVVIETDGNGVTPSAGAILRSGDSNGSIEYVRPNVQENLFFNYEFYDTKYSTSQNTWWWPAAFPGYDNAIVGWHYNDLVTADIGYRRAFTRGQTDVPGAPRYYIEQGFTVGGGVGLWMQKLPLIYKSSRRTMTFSCWYKTSRSLTDVYGTDALTFGCSQNFGSTTSSGSASNSDTNLVELHVMPSSTTWTHYTRTFTVDAATTVYDESEAALCLWLHANSTINDFDFYVAQPKLEWGNVYTGMPIYDRLQQKQKSAEYWEMTQVGQNGYAHSIALPLITNKQLISRKRHKDSVSTSVSDILVSNATMGSVTYYPLSQSIGVSINISAIGSYYATGYVFTDAHFNGTYL